MALWTPYIDETALDLSKSNSRIPQYSFDYGFYPPGCVSPGSSSGYDSIISPRNLTLSPPASPETAKRSYNMIEADCLSDDPDFQEYERNALRVMAEKNGGALLGNNPRMRRSVRSTNSDATDAYRRQRDRNNFAAKQSRDRRKLREIHLALKVSYLKKEVASLKAALRSRVCSNCRYNCLC